MCLCSKYKKVYSAQGLYHGRPPQVLQAAPSQVMIKKTPQMGATTMKKN